MPSGFDVEFLPVERNRRFYVATKNPLFVWAAYQHCHREGQATPDWVLEYFDRAAANLDGLVKSPKRKRTEPSALISEALEFKKSGRSGRGNPLLDADIKWMSDDVGLVNMVGHLIDGGVPVYKACLAVAADAGVSEPTVRRAWKKYGKTRPAGRPLTSIGVCP